MGRVQHWKLCLEEGIALCQNHLQILRQEPRLGTFQEGID